ncbi:uncharacterized protein C8Q71DRAFT_790960 [Rhodofomes roseus]|uniref:Uncharacterized protein n=1 Tax=Rhodofomes roseus TaxID=34475 RepID=A0ABQ8JZ91_9APHY|nr:uncharacterized protein C8Q71DRAFT_790960 [Rhodofomes roseus]KAH9829396.1 hypothetical protein C8Q71DRAFT_790960 [Rhodofomes roseus]
MDPESKEGILDSYFRNALNAHCMSRLDVQPVGCDDSQDVQNPMLHDLIDTTDNSYPRHIHTSCETDVMLYLHRLKSAETNGGIVVCKMAMATIQGEENLQHEAEIYEAPYTEPLRGNIMPNYFGLFRGVVDEQTVTCMVLEFCGEAVSGSLHEQKESFRKAVIEAYLELHSERIQLVKGGREDYKTRDIIRRSDGTPCLVDFSEACRHIGGPCVTSELEYSDYKTPHEWPRSDLECGELLAVFGDAWVFVSARLEIRSASMFIHYDKDASAQDYWDTYGRAFKAQGYSREDGLALIQQACQKHEDHLERRLRILDEVERVNQ